MAAVTMAQSALNRVPTATVSRSSSAATTSASYGSGAARAFFCPPNPRNAREAARRAAAYRNQNRCSATWGGGCGPRGGVYWGVGVNPNMLNDMMREMARQSPIWGDVYEKAAEAVNSRPFPVDIDEDDDMYQIMADMPGLRKDDVTVQVSQDRILTIRGERKVAETSEDTEASAPKRNRRRTERPTGAFLRKLKLPENAETDSITARMEDGVLTLKIWKTVKAEPLVTNVSIE